MVPAKRALILTIDAGFGHRSVAKAVAAALADSYGNGVRVAVCNPLEHERIPTVIRNSQSDYDRIVRALPDLYRMGYRASEARVSSRLVERATALVLSEVMADIVKAHRPDVIISTFPLFPATLAWNSRRNERHVPVLTVVTDLVMVHRLWFHKGADLYLVPTPQAQEQALQEGLDRAQLRVTGIPVHPRLAQPSEPAAARAEVGLQPDLLTVLAVGSKRVTGLGEVLHVLNHGGWPLQLVAVAGGDEALYRRLLAEEWHVPTRVILAAQDMPTLLHAADCVVCKAGGVMVTEALACGLPLLLVDVLPGQEIGNAQYVISGGAGELAKSPLDALEIMGHWLCDGGSLLATRAQKARLLGRPQAAHDVAALAWAAAAS